MAGQPDKELPPPARMLLGLLSEGVQQLKILNVQLGILNRHLGSKHGAHAPPPHGPPPQWGPGDLFDALRDLIGD